MNGNVLIRLIVPKALFKGKANNKFHSNPLQIECDDAKRRFKCNSSIFTPILPTFFHF